MPLKPRQRDIPKIPGAVRFYKISAYVTGVMLLLKMLPTEVRASSAERARQQRARGKTLFGVLGVVFLLWIALMVYLLQR